MNCPKTDIDILPICTFFCNGYCKINFKYTKMILEKKETTTITFFIKLILEKQLTLSST